MTRLPVLLADVGGTNTRFALGSASGVIDGSAHRVVNVQVESFEAAAAAYLAQVKGPKPDRLCVAIAGPVSGGQGKLTNGDWRFEPRALSSALGLHATYVINDLAALGYAVPVLPQTAVTQLNSGTPSGSQKLVAGVATGFNVSLAQGKCVAEAELGHASLPASVAEVLANAIVDKSVRFHSNEMLFSGAGLERLHLALGHEALGAPEITGQDGATLDLFARLLGVFCREMTYHYMPLAGLYFNGSLARAVLQSRHAAAVVEEAGRDQAFAVRFGQVPLYLITEDSAALFGCARYVQLQD